MYSGDPDNFYTKTLEVGTDIIIHHHRALNIYYELGLCLMIIFFLFLSQRFQNLCSLDAKLSTAPLRLSLIDWRPYTRSRPSCSVIRVTHLQPGVLRPRIYARARLPTPNRARCAPVLCRVDRGILILLGEIDFDVKRYTYSCVTYIYIYI